MDSELLRLATVPLGVLVSVMVSRWRFRVRYDGRVAF